MYARDLRRPGPTARALRVLMGCVLGLLAAECLLRLLVPFPIFYATWFEPGIHRPDAELGFVFTPGYRGGMRHADRTWYVPLELDAWGLREPMTQGPANGTAADVVLVGGRSMLFCYGLESADTIAARIAQRISRPVTVHTLAWPGFNLARDVRKFERFLAPQVRPEVVLVCLYGEADYEELRRPFARPPAVASENFFRYHDGLVLEPPGALAQRLGRRYFQSYALAGLARQVEQVQGRVRQFVALGRGRSEEDRVANGASPPAPQVGEDGVDLVTYLQTSPVWRDARILVVALPGRTERAGPRELASLVPPGRPTLDLRDALEGASSDWKAEGHYGPRSAAALGARIAEALEQVMAQPPISSR